MVDERGGGGFPGKQLVETIGGRNPKAEEVVGEPQETAFVVGIIGYTFPFGTVVMDW